MERLALSAPPAQLRVRAAGIDFTALAWGPRDGPLALCLHGYPDTARTWRHLGPLLAERGWRVVAPYMRGYAPSGLAPDGDYGLAALARDPVALHAQLQGDERSVLIGHDWGAAATYLVAGDSRARFARAVTLAVPPAHALISLLGFRAGIAGNASLAVRQLRLSWYMLFQQLPWISERSLPRLIPWLWQQWSPGYDAREDVPDVLQSLAESVNRTAALSYYRAVPSTWPRGRDSASEAAALLAAPKIPLLYLHGERDGCLHPEIARRAGAALPAGSCFKLVPDAGHFLHLERPQEVGEAIAVFLGEVTARPRA